MFCNVTQDVSNKLSGLDLTDQISLLELRLYMSSMLLRDADAFSMAHGLEVRSPFLDIDLVDFARRLPSEWKLRGGQSKWILRRAFEPWLPDEIVKRPKQGFGIPVARWIAESRPPFDRAPRTSFAAQRVSDHTNRRGDHRLYLYAQWLLDSFEDRTRPQAED